MTWFKTDDGMWRHRKVRRLGRQKVSVTAQVGCMGLWQLAGNWAADNETDGFVPAEQVEQWDPRLQLAERLVDAKLWHPTEDDGEPGYRFHDWHDYQPTAEEVQDKRTKRQEAGRRGGIKSGQTRRSKTEANASAGASSKTEAKTNPVPSRKETTHLEQARSDPNAHENAPHEAIPAGPGATGPNARNAWTAVQATTPAGTPQAVRGQLARAAQQLLDEGQPGTLVTAALLKLHATPNAGPGLLPNILADLQKEQAGVNAYNVRSSGSGARSARSEKVQGWAELGRQMQEQLDAGQPVGFAPLLIEGGRSA